MYVHIFLKIAQKQHLLSLFFSAKTNLLSPFSFYLIVLYQRSELEIQSWSLRSNIRGVISESSSIHLITKTVCHHLHVANIYKVLNLKIIYFFNSKEVGHIQENYASDFEFLTVQSSISKDTFHLRSGNPNGSRNRVRKICI